MQLRRAGRDRHSGARLPRLPRTSLAAQAAPAILAGAILYAVPSALSSSWPWELTDLTSKAVGTWLVGTGVTAAFVAAVDDRAALPGWALAQVVLGAGVLASLVRPAGDVDLLAAGGLPVVAYFAWTLASGTAGTWFCWKDGRFDRTPALGGIPVEVRVSPAAAG